MARVGSDGRREGGRRRWGWRPSVRPSVASVRHEKDVFVRVNRAVTCIQRRRRHRRSEAKRSRIVETAEYLISDRMMAEKEEEGKE